jgi:hypothetical protein
LVVGVGVDHNVGTLLEGTLYSGHEGLGEPAVRREVDDMVDAVRSRHLHRAVCAAVIDDQPLDAVAALDGPRQGAQRLT